MASDLDKKLEEILFGDTPRHFFSDNMLKKPEQIKQAFKETGWVRKLGDISGVNIVVDPKLMTGQEWYDRFITELKKPWTDEELTEPYYQHDDQSYVYTADHVHEAAKKAAGIE